MRALLALLAALLLPGPAEALIARLSTEQVSVTTAFTGESVLVFGTTTEALGPAGPDILVVARGPATPFAVRRKVQVLGMWFNGPSAVFPEVPGFYAIAGTRPAWQILPEEDRQARALGLDALPLHSTGARGPAFRAALLRLKTAAEAWQEDQAKVEIAGERLFKLRLSLPSTVPAGDYVVDVLLVSGREVVASERLGFVVARSGTAARLESLARGQPVLYAVLCIVVAMLAGWLGSVLFRRV